MHSIYKDSNIIINLLQFNLRLLKLSLRNSYHLKTIEFKYNEIRLGIH